ncbi:unnamed protein product [Rotaria sordida]|uniref:G-protein coupled receptors family 1 profile domain-containing protein n=1 Tax=Rotaria sordida TaxID=392033 RepID=A0A813X8L3_9BILA|nr:unnamed protein product [Rotaria sordida]CAF0863279.1 unnamed protein product [Rotaria sordida]CAF0864701.1 unnamed protein product [Rotaria sordida]CAF0900266.1 unnamed protein product [Rotaria sordida]CAF0908753.1 unnamed protein product [Rotaria sordida]
MMNEATLVTSNIWSIKANLTSSYQQTISDQLRQPTRQATFIGAILAFVFIFFGLIGNIILITTILSVKKLRSYTINIFIVSLQFNDLLNIGFNQFFVGLSYVNRGWLGGPVVCKLVVYFSTICMGCLLWHHCLIAIHRLIVVVYPNLLRRMSIKTYIIVSLVITRILPILCCIPSFLTDSIAYSPKALRCSIRNKLQIYINITILILLPNVIIIFCFVGIFFQVFHATHTTGRMNANSISISHSLRREIRITKMFAVLFTLFFLGYHPYGFVRAFDKRGQLHPDIYVLLTLLYCISICASPLVYGIMNNQLRHECMRVLFNCWRCQKKNNNYEKCSHHRLKITETKSLTVTNGISGVHYNTESPLMVLSIQNRSTLISSKKKTPPTTVLDTADV